MRTLIFFISAAVSFSAAAQIKSVGITYSSSDYKPKSGALTVEERLRNSIKDVSLSLNEIYILDNWKTSLILSQNVADYSEYRIYDTNGTNYTSLGGKLTEQNILIDQIINFGPHIFEIITASNLGTTPLRKSNISVVYLKKINNLNTVSMTLGTQKQNLPANYFQNPNNNSLPEARPTELDSNTFEFSWDHIFTANYKNRIELSTGQRVQDRPVRYGLNLKNIYVLNDIMALRGDVGYSTERRSDALKSDLGYQTSSWIETKFLHSINTYINYGVGYAVEINQEFRPWSNSTEQLGNDQILADLNYEASRWNLNLSAAFAKYNTGQSGTNMKVGFGWNL